MELIKELQRIELETTLLLSEKVSEKNFIKINKNINFLCDTCNQLKDEALGKTKEYRDIVEGIKFLEEEEMNYKLLLVREGK